MILNTILSILLLVSFNSEPGVRFMLDGKGIKKNQISISKMKTGDMKFEVVGATKVFKDEPYTFDFTVARDKESVVHIDNHDIMAPFNLPDVVKSLGDELQAGDRLIFLFENIQSETSWIYQFDVVE